ncbi:MAG: ABC transporter ATP-binding protein [Acidimicrobiia bacterium]
MIDALISVSGVTVTFGSTRALDGFSLDVEPGALVTLVGPSGCGKTTALRVIAGFQDADAGTVRIRDIEVLGPSVNIPPEKRRVGMVFQEYALFPHISVAENVGYGVQGSDRVERVGEVLDLVGLAGYGPRYPHELSGGEQQRVALARALAPAPDVVLLDEPFSNLDAPQRERMRREIKKIIKSAGVTAILVTHDQAEALAIADIVGVMRSGAIIQIGKPDEVYRKPVSRWVAGFLGDAVIMRGTVTDGAIATSIGSIPYDLPDGSAVTVMIRPEWLRPVRTDTGGFAVVDTEFYGHDQRVEIDIGGDEPIEALVSSLQAIHAGDTVTLEVLDAAVYPEVTSQDSASREGHTTDGDAHRQR